jgi:NADPH-dependent 2,4-dienoyl-CoA reductase/sulfur reductase-like enzyme
MRIISGLLPGMQMFDTAVIGAGPAGLAAARGAVEAGAESVLILERDTRPGGILNQCIHDGFGLYRYRKVLTGPEYAFREVEALESPQTVLALGTFVQSLKKEAESEGGCFILLCMAYGRVTAVRARTVVSAMGCRERTAGAVSLPGNRPAGIFTAGTAQRLMNIQNIRVGSRALIIGSGDIGLIMARRLTLEGAEVAGVTEIQSYAGGLERNIRQCLHDFNIPLHLSTGILSIEGRERVSGVRIAPLLADGSLDTASARLVPCDTVLLSVGLIPEHELLREAGAEIDPVTRGPVVDGHLMTSVAGLFAGGNVLQVHDLVDHASHEAQTAGMYAARFCRGELDHGTRMYPVTAGKGIQYVVPQQISAPGTVHFSLRTTAVAAGLTIALRRRDSRGGSETLYQRLYNRVFPSQMIRFRVECPAAGALEVTGEQA